MVTNCAIHLKAMFLYFVKVFPSLCKVSVTITTDIELLIQYQCNSLKNLKLINLLPRGQSQ